MIPANTIQEILDAAHIEEVIGDFVMLKKRGANLFGLCPFHNEKTPSFTVSPSKGIFKCFGCGKSGNAVHFLMEHERLSYPEALKSLAKKYGVEVHEKELTTEEIESQNERESLFNLNQFAQKYFSEILWQNEKGKSVGLTYFRQKRGFTDQTIHKFQLGYCLPDRDAFTRQAIHEGYKIQYLEKSGLSILRDDKHFDRFHDRIIFPIHNITGRITGFGGRILTTDKTIAKYVNSPESEVYDKSKSLYGIFFAKNTIVAKNNCYLVEGYTDVISLHQAGIENVVASSGTSLTEDQIRIIRRFTENITILYDGDPAGIKASFRGIDMILEQGLNTRIVLFPDGEDPDSFVRKTSTTEVEKFLATNADNFVIFKAKILLKEAGNDPIKRAEMIRDIVGTIALIPNIIVRALYVRECASLLNIAEQTLMSEVNQILRKNFRKKRESTGEEPAVEPEATAYTAPKQFDFDPNSTEFQEKELIRLLLLYGTWVITTPAQNEDGMETETRIKIGEWIVHDLLEDDIHFAIPEFRRLFLEMVKGIENDFIPGDIYFIQHPDPELSKTAVEVVSTPHELSQNWKKYKIHVTHEKDNLPMIVKSAILALKARRLEQALTENQLLIKETRDDERIMELIAARKKLKERSLIINAELGRIIIR